MTTPDPLVSQAPQRGAHLRHVWHVMARYAPLVSRIVAAAVGGYALAALFSVAIVALPGAAADNVLWGMLGSFLVWSGAVLWVFAVSSASKAWWGLGLAALVLLPFAWMVGSAA